MDNPIGLFDSGFGGLTVMREVSRLMPKENLIYLGDTARLPYGNKSPQTIVQFAEENAQFLIEKKIKLLIIACHSACSHAIKRLENTLPIPVIGVVQPGFELLMSATRTGKVAILGTHSTINSQIYQTLIGDKAEVFPVACPLFVPLVEEGFFSTPAAKWIAISYFNPLKNKGIDAALLACTHYPLMRETIQEAIGSEVKLIEPAALCAEQARQYLAKNGQLNQQSNSPTYQFFATDDPEKFRRNGKIFLDAEITHVEKKQIYDSTTLSMS